MKMGLELALERWATRCIGWNDLSSGHRPQLLPFLAGWLCKHCEILSHEEAMRLTPQARDSFRVGFLEAETMKEIIERDENKED